MNGIRTISDEKIIIINKHDFDNIENLFASISSCLEKSENDKSLLEGMVKRGNTVVLVVPIDSEAPKGRLILPQVQVIRECLDLGVVSIVIRPEELKDSLNNFKNIDLVITDSQIFKEVSAVVPEEIRITSFSILFARQKGDIDALVAGAREIEKLNDGDTVLIAESCTHTTSHEDIGSVKIPMMIRKKTGKNIKFEFSHGKEFPKDLSRYKLIIQCGGCMLTRTDMMSRIQKSSDNNIPITNYGVVLSYLTETISRIEY